MTDPPSLMWANATPLAEQELAGSDREAVRTRRAQPLGDLRIRLLAEAEVLLEERDQRHRRQRLHGRPSYAGQHQPDLAAEVPRAALSDPLAVRAHLSLPVLDDEELIGVLALGDERRAGRHVDHFRVLGDRGALGLREDVEEVERDEAVG